MTNLGYDPKEESSDQTTPSEIGLLAADTVLEYRHHDGANQLGDLHPGAYSDYTEYVTVNTPDLIRDPDHWQPQFKAMFAATSRREFDCVLFWSLDRFSREGVLETLQCLQRLTSYGVAFKSFTEEYLDGTGMFRDAVISILATRLLVNWAAARVISLGSARRLAAPQ